MTDETSTHQSSSNRASTDRPSPERPSTPALIGDAIRQATELFTTEIALVRLEAGEKLTLALASVVSLVVAAVFIVVALIFLLQGLVELLIAKGLPAYQASLAVGGGIAVVAFLTVLVAIRNLRLSRLKPTRTLRQVETACALVKGKAP